jgi:hypothetical protein
MIRILYFLFLCVVLLSSNINAKKDNSEGRVSVAECSLYSDVYFEYLYAANFLYSKFFKRAVYTWRTWSIFSKADKFNVKVEFTEKDNKGIWSFEPVEGQKNAYYIKNLHYNEYMYTSQYRASFLIPLRYVYTNDRVKPEYRESYMWRIEKIDQNGRIALWNVKYKEPLYPAQCVAKDRSEYMRDVFTWPVNNDKTPVAFYWTLKCRDNILPS